MNSRISINRGASPSSVARESEPARGRFAQAPEWRGKMGLAVPLALATLLLLAAVPLRAAEPEAAVAAPEAVATVEQHDFVFPRRRQVEGFDLVLHAPQVRSWPDFERFAALMAIEVRPQNGGDLRYATATVQGATEVDMARRVVRVIDPEVVNVQFTGGEAPEAYRQAVRRASREVVLEVPVELFVAAVADDVLADPPPPGFNADPPVIAVRSKPTLLLFVNGAPVGSPIAGTGLEVLVNANWPVFREQGGKQRYFLLNRDRWYVSRALEKGWKATRELPEGFAKLPAEPQFEAVRSAVPAQKVSGSAPAVLYAAQPTELVVTEGRVKLEEIPGTGGLSFVTNTDSPLFELDEQWYLLAAGRWFTTSKLDKGPWTWVARPPGAFGQIPEDHAAAAVRASVPGTVEAKMAALEALLPTRVTARRGDKPAATVEFAGEPKFETIPGTTVARALNTSFDVLQVDQRYYLLYQGVWFEGEGPTGPWALATAVPDAIYAIPPSSPAYHMTQVVVADTTGDSVTYSYPASYSSNTYVVYGVPYYGTGWYYYPWIWGGYYYPYWGWGSYGYGSWYNPVTGGYMSRSVWYGPYGGYSYAQGYNPRTGRYGYVETGWDSDEWASHGETYNPRTGIGTATDRNYDADENRSSMERTTSRGDDWVKTERNTDFDSGTSTVERETSRGGSSEMQRQRTESGIASEGTITTGGGNEYDVSREWSDGQRTSTVSGDSGSITTETRRQNGNSVSSIEGSGGGQGLSIKGDNGRTTIGQSGSGDIYAGHNGNVYQKTEGGWQEYENGGWQDVEPPRRNEGATGKSGAAAEQRKAGQGQLGAATVGDLLGKQGQAGQRGQWQTNRPETSQLNRDYQARQRGQRQYEQRRAAQRGAYQRGGGGFRSMGGGFRGGMGRGGGRRR